MLNILQMRPSVNTYTRLFVSDMPLLDVRAPMEYERGAFPNAKNLPIMDDQQREIVGRCYRYHGRDQAIKKGHALVQGEVRETRIAAWMGFAKQNPNGSLYCFRGGLRSQIAQRWMHKHGVDFPTIPGGYKALRARLLEELEVIAGQRSLRLVGGKTGCGKTTLIKNLANGVDLEAAAYHRGSSFGGHARAQNNQINFENILAIELLKLRHAGVESFILEDEARTIGKVGIPKILFARMRASPLVVVEEPYEIRVERLIQEYVIAMHTEFIELEGETEGFRSFSSYLLTGLKKIQRRLGAARFGDIYKDMQQALAIQSTNGDITRHYNWLTAVLNNYYDPMYEDQLQRRKGCVCFRGSYDACLEFLRQGK